MRDAQIGAFWDADPMDAAMYIALVGALAAIVGAVFTGVQAKAATVSRADAVEAQGAAEHAQIKAEKAQVAALAMQEEANRIASDARTALDRSAAALERANELTEAAQPKPKVRWSITPSRGDLGLVKNVGELAAAKVELTGTAGIMTDEDSAAEEVPPGHTLEFAAWRGGGMDTPRLTISWDDPVSGKRESETIAIRW